MVDFDSALDALSKKNQRLQDDHSQVMARIALNKEKYVESMDALQALGCNSVKEAQDKIAQLESEIQQGLEDIMEELG